MIAPSSMCLSRQRIGKRLATMCAAAYGSHRCRSLSAQREKFASAQTVDPAVPLLFDTRFAPEPW
jgi:hypothetical protein